MLWTTIVLNKHIDLTLLQELIRRSQSSLPLEVIVKNGMPSETVDVLRVGFKSETNRVKTLYLDGNIRTNNDNMGFSDLTSFFPCLENIFCDMNSKMDSSFETPCVKPVVKALQISVRELGGLSVPGNFPQLRWLKIECGPVESLISLLEALQNLPNLQFLEFEPTYIDPMLAGPRVKFRDLKALTTGCSITQYMDAPKLEYLEIDGYLGCRHDGYLSEFNLSGITRICFDISGNIFRITSCNDNEAASFSASHVNDKSLNFHPTHTSYPNKLQITLEEDLPFIDEAEEFTMGSLCSSSPLFTGCVSKTTNLVEIFLRCPKPCIPGTVWSYERLIVFFTALKGATKTAKLHVSWDCCSFATLCQILSDGTLFPRLKRLTYCNEEESLRFLPDFPSLENLMKERFATGRAPLELGIQDISELLEKVERLGIRLAPILEGELAPN